MHTGTLCLHGVHQVLEKPLGNHFFVSFAAFLCACALAHKAYQTFGDHAGVVARSKDVHTMHVCRQDTVFFVMVSIFEITNLT